jgi:hypothetical protein
MTGTKEMRMSTPPPSVLSSGDLRRPRQLSEGDSPGSSDIPALTVILDGVVVSGERRRLGRRRLTRFPRVARGLICQRCVAAAVRDRRA